MPLEQSVNRPKQSEEKKAGRNSRSFCHGRLDRNKMKDRTPEPHEKDRAHSTVERCEKIQGMESIEKLWNKKKKKKKNCSLVWEESRNRLGLGGNRDVKNVHAVCGSCGSAFFFASTHSDANFLDPLRHHEQKAEKIARPCSTCRLIYCMTQKQNETKIIFFLSIPGTWYQYCHIDRIATSTSCMLFPFSEFVCLLAVFSFRRGLFFVLPWPPTRPSVWFGFCPINPWQKVVQKINEPIIVRIKPMGHANSRPFPRQDKGKRPRSRGEKVQRNVPTRAAGR